MTSLKVVMGIILFYLISSIMIFTLAFTVDQDPIFETINASNVSILSGDDLNNTIHALNISSDDDLSIKDTNNLVSDLKLNFASAGITGPMFLWFSILYLLPGLYLMLAILWAVWRVS